MYSFITFTLATAALTAAVPHARKHYQLHPIRDTDLEPKVMNLAPIAGRSAQAVDLLTGQCGGSTGKGCAPGYCCSQYGFCGQGPEYCGSGGGSSGEASPAAASPAPAYSAPPPASPSADSAAPSSPDAVPAPPSYSSPPSGGSSSGFSGYKMYSGNGSPGSGWPGMNQWMDFESAWAANKPNMMKSCAQWNVPNNSEQETDEIKSAIKSAASQYGMDERYILAVMMQESNGCVRVHTTNNGVVNPGLFQSHNGQGSCNRGSAMTPCPTSQISQMINDGVGGTSDGDGLKQCFQSCPSEGSQAYYQAAVIYNSGNLPSNLDDNTATPCYASDLANRLMGWSEGITGCTL